MNNKHKSLASRMLRFVLVAGVACVATAVANRKGKKQDYSEQQQSEIVCDLDD